MVAYTIVQYNAALRQSDGKRLLALTVQCHCQSTSCYSWSGLSLHDHQVNLKQWRSLVYTRQQYPTMLSRWHMASTGHLSSTKKCLRPPHLYAKINNNKIARAGLRVLLELLSIFRTEVSLATNIVHVFVNKSPLTPELCMYSDLFRKPWGSWEYNGHNLYEPTTGSKRFFSQSVCVLGWEGCVGQSHTSEATKNTGKGFGEGTL